MMLMQIKGEESNMNSVTVVEHSGERVPTTEQLAEAYGCTARNINDNFNNNRERFEAGKHFYCLEGEDLSAFKHDPENIGLVASNASHLYLWTKRGAARHSKLNGAKVRRRALETWMASMEGKDLSDPANPAPITKGDAA